MNLDELSTHISDVAWGIRENPPSSVEGLAVALSTLRESKKALSDAERVVEATLAEAMGSQKQAIVAGVGVLERKSSPKSPRWDHENLSKRLAAMSRDERIVDDRTGEIEPGSDAAIRVFLDCAQVSYYRLDALKRRGLDPKEFRTEEGWRTAIRITAPS